MDPSSKNVYTAISHRRRKLPNWRSLILLYAPYPQTFSLPKSFISYFMKSDVTKAQRKLIYSCQYFSLRIRFYPFEGVSVDKRKMEDHATCYDEIDENRVFKKGPEICHRFNFLNAPFKISINDIFFLNGDGTSPNLASQLLQKVYQCNLKSLSLYQQHISYKDYLLLTGAKKLKYLNFNMNVVTYDNGDIVPFEDILKEIPKLEVLLYAFHFDDISKTAVTEHSMRNLLKLPPFKNLTKVRFSDMPKIINPEEFAQFVLKQSQKCSYKLWYIMTDDDGVIDNFNEAFNTVIKSWKVEETKPELFVGKSSVWITD